MPNVEVRVYNARGELVCKQAVITLPHQTFARVMRKTCEKMGIWLAEYDVSTGGLLLNGNTAEMHTFGIPDGHWMLVALRAKAIDSCF
jgi:hypothetical protein